MTQRGAVGGDWQGTMRGEERVLMNLWRQGTAPKVPNSPINLLGTQQTNSYPNYYVFGIKERRRNTSFSFLLILNLQIWFKSDKKKKKREREGEREREFRLIQYLGNRIDFALTFGGGIAENKPMTGSIAYIPSPTGRALSLLSSKKETWATSSELSLRSSAALRELIAENRAAILARQLILDRDWHLNHAAATDDFGGGGGGVGFHQQQGLYCEQQQQQQSWEGMNENGGAHVTLDLMQAPSTAFGMLSVRGKSKEEDEECCELWNSFHDHDSHVV